jgi:hypothetical protein
VSDDPASDGTMTVTSEATRVDARSRVDISADDVPDGINAAAYVAGLSCSLHNPAAYVER